MLKKIKIEEAVGMKLAHDITRIVPGKFKGAAFCRGQVVRKGDIPKLLDLGSKRDCQVGPWRTVPEMPSLPLSGVPFWKKWVILCRTKSRD